MNEFSPKAETNDMEQLRTMKRSLRSLFLHLGAMPSSATGGGIPSRPAAPPGCIILFYITALIDFLLSVRGASLRNTVAALCPTEGQTPQEPFKFTRDILPFLARFVNLKAMRLRSFRQVLRFIPLKMLFVPFLIFFSDKCAIIQST